MIARIQRTQRTAQATCTACDWTHPVNTNPTKYTKAAAKLHTSQTGHTVTVTNNARHLTSVTHRKV